MSSNQTPQIDVFINRGVTILRNNTTLFPDGYPPTTGNNLITDVISQGPSIEQSPDLSLMPLIFVTHSQNPIRKMDYRGRDDRQTAGSRMYYLEFYNIIIVREVTKEASLQKLQELSTTVRDAYQSNLGMASTTTGTDYIAVTNEVIATPYVLRAKDPAIQAINVICRPQQISSVRIPA